MNTSKLANKTILVTGGAGFIGSNLCEALLDLNAKVVCLDNFSTGKRENLVALQKSSNFLLIEGDIRNLETCKKAVEGVDYVLHQAALGSVPRSIKDPITSNEVNVSGFLNILVASKEASVKRFVYAASSSTYGDSKSMPKVEEVIGMIFLGKVIKVSLAVLPLILEFIFTICYLGFLAKCKRMLCI